MAQTDWLFPASVKSSGIAFANPSRVFASDNSYMECLYSSGRVGIFLMGPTGGSGKYFTPSATEIFGTYPNGGSFLSGHQATLTDFSDGTVYLRVAVENSGIAEFNVFDISSVPAGSSITDITARIEHKLAPAILFGDGNSIYVDSVSLKIKYTPPAPVASFSGSPTTGTHPLSVSFTNASTNASSYLWDFGDGNTSTSTSPSHTYDDIGTYDVTLTATGDHGTDSITKAAYIHATAATISSGASSALVMGATAAPSKKLYRSASTGLVMGAAARAVVRKDPSAVEEKRYLLKVYDENGTYVETWKDVVSEPSFSEELNQLGSTLDIELARNSDSLGQVSGQLNTEAGTTITTEAGFPILATTTSRNQVGEGSSVIHNNRVDVYVFYGSVEPLYTENGEEITTEDGEQILATLGHPNGFRIFSGFIAKINPRYGDTETTLVQLMSYGYDLDQYPVTDGAGNTTVTFNSYDPSNIAKALVDQFRTDATADVDYSIYTDRDALSIATSGTVVSYTFRVTTYGDALKKVLELMPSDWYMRVGLGDNLVYYQQRATTPHHYFYLGKHIKDFNPESYIGTSYNRVLVTGGGDPALYRETVAAPAPRTRRTLQLYSDARLEDPTSADIIGQGIVDQNNMVQYRGTLNILHKTYDIESVQVGQMIGFRNFGNYIDTLMMQVVARTYTPDVLTLQLDTLPLTVNKRLEDLKRNMLVSDNQNVPDSPS